MRGKQNRSIHNFFCLHRIIPARTGNRLVLLILLRSSTDHPCKRRKQRLGGNAILANYGSARAGNSVPFVIVCRLAADHPRTRGKQTIAPSNSCTKTGSSPHTRETGSLELYGLKGTRIIPAHTGNSSKFRQLCYKIADHPRTRGKQGCPVPPDWVICGSSRMRGKQ